MVLPGLLSFRLLCTVRTDLVEKGVCGGGRCPSLHRSRVPKTARRNLRPAGNNNNDDDAMRAALPAGISCVLLGLGPGRPTPVHIRPFAARRLCPHLAARRLFHVTFSQDASRKEGGTVQCVERL
jgi:hypothetical protein